MALSQGATSLPFAPKSHNHISESTATTKPMAMQTDTIKSLKIVMPNAVWSAPSAGPAQQDRRATELEDQPTRPSLTGKVWR
jgi:hypothetical protein